MKRTLTTLALAAAMMVLAIPAAAANSENSNDTAGAGTIECRPGADNGLIGPWTPIEKDDYVAEVIARVPTDHPDYDNIVNNLIPQSADATWDFCDKNRDGVLCVMRTDPSPYYWLLLDNRPFKATP
jgi:hypothetical protein